MTRPVPRTLMISPGAISRSVDDIVITLKNTSANPVPFGAAIFLDTGGGGVPVSANSAFDRFVGFAVRAAEKTPEEYSSSRAEWLPGDIMEVLVRGTVLAPSMSESPTPGDAVYLRKTDGKVTGQDGSGANIALTNCRFRKAPASAGVAEVVVMNRNIQ